MKGQITEKENKSYEKVIAVKARQENKVFGIR